MPVRDTLPMAADSADGAATKPLSGHVVVVAAHTGAARAAVALTEAGAAVAVISDEPDAVRIVEENVAGSNPLLAFRADPTDPEVWARVVPHLEQRLGPIDAVAADRESHDAVPTTLLDDLRRRGHGGVVAIEEVEVVSAVIQAIRRTP